ncbi:MAG TPA: L-seryl-tRNA(Sec) selenium transferase, partial [Desulfurivibrionaceae bacterium]|nr:L-seryl-tRNA(Sec) selenium transferase [Desulfurivibrionaceae bacterium]
PAEIGIKARRLKRLLTKPLADHCRVALLPTVSRVGGGALPEYDLPSVAVSLAPATFSVNELEIRLRRSTEPVLGRIENDLFLLDLRTVAESEIKRLAVTIFKIFGVQP